MEVSGVTFPDPSELDNMIASLVAERVMHENQVKKLQAEIGVLHGIRMQLNIHLSDKANQP